MVSHKKQLELRVVSKSQLDYSLIIEYASLKPSNPPNDVICCVSSVLWVSVLLHDVHHNSTGSISPRVLLLALHIYTILQTQSC